jgi:hypothetical protein
LKSTPEMSNECTEFTSEIQQTKSLGGGTSDSFFQLDEDWAFFFLMIRIEKAISAVRKKHNSDNRNHPGSQHMSFFEQVGALEVISHDINSLR